MKGSGIRYRLMRDEDFQAVVAIDEKVLKTSRSAYYELKFERLFESKEYVPTSLVAHLEDGTVVGFIMGELYIGEFGISEEGATLDTIGVDPRYQNEGIGEQLVNEFVDHLKDLGVRKINTLVDRKDEKLLRFFNANRFEPSNTVINLERSI